MARGENIQKARKMKGVSQGELANLLGVAQVNVHQWESGKRNPKIETLKRIATALEIPVDNLLGNEWKGEGSELIDNLREATNVSQNVEDLEEKLINFLDMLPVGIYLDFVEMFCNLTEHEVEVLTKYGRFMKANKI